MVEHMVVIITGANRGIGKAIVQMLVTSITHPLTIYATSRSGVNLAVQTPSNIEIKYPELDISSPSNVAAFAKLVESTHDDVGVLINNAAAHDGDKTYSPEIVKHVIDTNVWGTLRMCEAFIPLLKKGVPGRIVNVSSTASSLANYSQQIQQRFRDAKTLSDLDTMLQEYQRCATNKSEAKSGWPKSAYSVSKASTNALTAILARQNPDILVNCCCPGWVDTDMGSIAGSRPPKSPEDGAKIPIKLAFEDLAGVTGKYWANRSVAGTGDGQVLEW